MDIMYLMPKIRPFQSFPSLCKFTILSKKQDILIKAKEYARTILFHANIFFK